MLDVIYKLFNVIIKYISGIKDFIDSTSPRSLTVYNKIEYNLIDLSISYEFVISSSIWIEWMLPFYHNDSLNTRTVMERILCGFESWIQFPIGSGRVTQDTAQLR